VYAEIGLPPEDTDRPGLVASLESQAGDALHRLGWISRELVVCRVTHLIRCAYVHLTPERERVLPEIMPRLERHGIFPIGRYGCWDYTSMEDSILSGIETARRVTE
jgi:hypothetical protein